MSTKHNPAAKSTKRPAICRKGVVGLPVAYVAGRPTSLSCFCLATETSGYARIAESFRIFWDPARRHWIGASSESGRNLEAIVTALPTLDHYEFEINVRDGDTVIGHFAWDDVRVDAGPPWNSGLLQRPPAPTVPGFEMHVLN